MPNVDNWRNRILEKAHTSRYSIHLGFTKMYHNLREAFLWDVLKWDMGEFVTNCPNFEQVKASTQSRVAYSKKWKFHLVSVKSLIWSS